MLRTLLTRRWLGYLTVTIIFSVVTSLFGSWQWDRRQEALLEIQKVESNYDLVPYSLTAILDLKSEGVDGKEWSPVALEGEYHAEQTVLARTRPRAGAVGFEVLVPFTSGEQTIIVNRGWIPSTSNAAMPADVPPAPKGTIRITGSVRPPEPLIAGRGAPAGQIPSINLESIQEQTKVIIREDFFIDLRQESESESLSPIKPERPELDEGPHLSYSFQWYLFGIMAIFGLVYQLRLTTKNGENSSGPPRQSLDAEEEDAIIEGSRPV